MRTCLECARFVYQDAEIGVGIEHDQHVVLRCSRDRWALNMRDNNEAAFRKALEYAEKCEHFYDAKALGVE